MGQLLELPKSLANDWREVNMKNFGVDLSFSDIPEWQRTKHVHRLHPYLGKFIPQLVNVFLKKYFRPNQWILDPFMGSGTTIIEANILGMNAIGVELSIFNTLITKIKTQEYNISQVEKEIKDILEKTKEFSKIISVNQSTLSKNYPELKIDSEYFNTWFSERALKEILFYRSQIGNYENQDLLRIILSRATRSARQITHYDLARPTKPVKEKYWCIKHKRTCEPIGEALKFINRYSLDTIERIQEFDKLRTDKEIKILQGDSRTIELPITQKIDGIFTSPPYVGLIDYHEQHKYAYGLFNFQNNDHREIGPMSKGQGAKAREEYKQDIIAVFKNMSKYLKENAKVFIVVNDKNNMYPEIAQESGFVIKDIFHRPVLNRTERDNYKFTESIYYLEKVD
ncbi:TPA: hypothetical protein H1012_03075 [archaeon]|nr:hypothetical protein [Candidatus Naiadarchaeales archaeon SRR2090159.bin1288]